MLRDLHVSHPAPHNLLVHPTTRADPPSNLALSSRNAYLSPRELASAPTLHRALSAAQSLYFSSNSSTATSITAGAVKAAAQSVIAQEAARTSGLVACEYVELFDPVTFQAPADDEILRVGGGGGGGRAGNGLVLAGAMRCGGTRLIDNLLMGVELGNGIPPPEMDVLE